MLYTTWTYIGYDAAVFLAGLGNISPELYEAARIDGAGGWSIFRYITLPLLSPTTFFLSLIAVIGTFQAFTQIWIMRTPASQRAVDTLGVYIFETVRSTDPNMGYGSAMAFVLFGGDSAADAFPEPHYGQQGVLWLRRPPNSKPGTRPPSSRRARRSVGQDFHLRRADRRRAAGGLSVPVDAERLADDA